MSSTRSPDLSDCERIRHVLPRAAEGDAGPEESLLLARHLSECTACRIVLARERRLQDVLAGLRDPIEVESSFLDRVMAALPAVPPRAASKPARRRGLKLAVFAGLVGSLGAAAAAWSQSPTWAASDTWLPALTPEMPERWAVLFATTARLATLALAQMGIGPEAGFGFLSLPAPRSIAVVVGTGAAALLLFAAVAVARLPFRVRQASTQSERP